MARNTFSLAAALCAIAVTASCTDEAVLSSRQSDTPTQTVAARSTSNQPGEVVAARAASRPVKLLPPTRGIYHAAFAAFGPTEDVVTPRHINDFTNRISGKPLTWAYFSDNWFNGIHFPRRDVDVIRASGVIPFIRIMSRSNWEACSDRRYQLSKIIAGDFDPALRRYARAARDVPGPLMMEFGTEANGDWFPWSGYCNGGGKRDGYGSPRLADGPERFRDAYRHLIDLFREEGATNVTWVFHMDAWSAPEQPWNRFAAYYPGDDYIDWLGLSVYGAQTPSDLRNWNPDFNEALNRGYREMSSVSSSKPIAVLEFGVVEHKRKPEWIRNALATLSSGRYPRVKAISWWHSDWPNDDGSWSRMKIDSSRASLAAYRNAVADPAFISTPVIAR